MTVSRIIARLGMTKKQQEAFTPPPGIDVIWLEANSNNYVAEFCVSDIRVDNRLRWTEEKLRNYIRDNLNVIQFHSEHYLSPRKTIREEVDFDHPFLDDPVSAKIKKNNIRNVRPYRITDDQLKRLNRMLDKRWGLRPAKPIKRLSFDDVAVQSEGEYLAEVKNRASGITNQPQNVNVMQIAEIENEDTVEDMNKIIDGLTSGSAPRREETEAVEKQQAAAAAAAAAAEDEDLL